MNCLIDICDISKQYKSKILGKTASAVEGLSFQVKKGEVTGLLGPNGAGKTTTLKCILQLTSFQTGAINYFEKGCKRPDFTKIGYLPERPYFMADLKAREYLEFLQELHGLEISLFKPRCEAYTKRFGIYEHLEKKIKTYSKGMLQRLGMVAALIHEPLLLILDEPMAGLDPLGRKLFKDIIVEENQKGKSILLSSHILSDVQEICSEIILLEQGKLTYAGKLNGLIEENSDSQYLAEIKEKQGIKRHIVHESELSNFIGLHSDTLVSLNKSSKGLEEIIYRGKS